MDNDDVDLELGDKSDRRRAYRPTVFVCNPVLELNIYSVVFILTIPRIFLALALGAQCLRDLLLLN